MNRNMGTADRAIRTIAALVVGGLIWNGTLHGTLAIVLGVLAIVFLLTSAVGFCPLYLPLRLNTGARKDG